MPEHHRTGQTTNLPRPAATVREHGGWHGWHGWEKAWKIIREIREIRGHILTANEHGLNCRKEAQNAQRQNPLIDSDLVRGMFVKGMGLKEKPFNLNSSDFHSLD